MTLFVHKTARLGCSHGAGGVGWTDRIPDGTLSHQTVIAFIFWIVVSSYEVYILNLPNMGSGSGLPPLVNILEVEIQPKYSA